MSGYHYDPMLWPTLGSSAFIGLIAIYLWRRRADTKGASTLAMVATLLVVWCLAGAAESAATDFATQRAWFVFRDALTLPGVILGFCFALQYAGLERWLTRPVLGVLVAVAILHISLEVVDDGRLLWSSIGWDREIRGDRTQLGLLFAAFATAMFLLSTAVFALLFVRSPAHRVPVALILVGQIGLRVLYPIAVFNVVYVPNIVAGVLGFDLVAAMYAIALIRFRMFDLVPVARQTMFSRLPDPLLVLDPADRIADLNHAAERLLGLSARAVLRQPLAAVLAAFPGAEAIGASHGTALEVAFEKASGTSIFEVVGTPLADWQGRVIGRMVLLHDITPLRGVEAQLVERERALAAAQERERMARELHDGLSQDLWLAKLKAGRLAALRGLPEEARSLTDEVSAAIDAGLDEAREAVATMRLTGEPGGGLGDLLARRLEDFEDRFGLAVEVDVSADLPGVSPRAEAEILRIAQEALTNVRRHADATVVRVRAAVEGRAFVLEVRDNGRGFDPGAVGDSAYGLAGMRERAALIGGELRFESAPRKGTRVRLEVPVARAVETAEPALAGAS